MTLAQIAAQLADFEIRFPDVQDTHIFASTAGITALSALIPHIPGKLTLAEFAGLKIWHDATVSDNELELGRIEWQDDFPRKIVTKVVNLHV